MRQDSTGAGQAQGPRSARPVPISTYRLQLNKDFTFRDACELTGYLHELGISDCYASPVFRAGPDSLHGYDTCDFGELSPALGTPEDFHQWTDRLRGLDMGLLLDFVPNHMGADPCNPWWREVLENGEWSRHAEWFDINWRSRDEELRGKVLLPVLEARYGEVLESGKLRLELQENGFAITYGKYNFPISPDSEAWLQKELLAFWRQANPQTAVPKDFISFFEIVAKLRSSRTSNGPAMAQARQQLQEWRQTRPEARESLDQALRQINGTPGVDRSFDQLHALLLQQHYRLAVWRMSGEEINYRRFFDISDLVSLRIELPEVFEAAHGLLMRLLAEGRITGLRIDHPDGLWNPKEYFDRLQQSYARLYEGAGVAGSEERQAEAYPLYIVAEKILGANEALPRDWPVAGTTGYDFLNRLNGLFVNAANRTAFDELYFEFSGNRSGFRSYVYAGKKKILQTSLHSDLLALACSLKSVASRTRYGMDFSLREFQEGLTEMLASFPVYRTYLTEESKVPTVQERAFIEEATQFAKHENRRLDAKVLEFIETLLLLSTPHDLDQAGCELCRQFVMKFQQLSGPAMAKGLEDTAFYKFNRLISLNEVGGDPDLFGTDLEAFHEFERSQAAAWPGTLLATSTHDTKRGEDTRARINVLSELPGEWRQAVTRWRGLNSDKKAGVNGKAAPDTNDEYLLYQALVGVWPSEAQTGNGLDSLRERIGAYMLKAIREAKVHSSWTEPDRAYEQATRGFVDKVLTNPNPFVDDFMLFHRKVAFFGLFNSLAQVTIKMTAPGVPDFYQGTELWDYSLVDPDNRRPVDYEVRRRLLADLQQRLPHQPQEMPGFLRELLRNYQTGQIKLYLIWRTLNFRRRQRELFETGRYIPIFATGKKRAHVCAFARKSSDASAMTVASRLVVGLTDGAERWALEPEVWQDTVLPVPEELPGTRYRNVLTGQDLVVPEDGSGWPLRVLLESLPVAVLERVTPAAPSP